MSILEVDLGYEPFPKQRAFHANPAKYRLFGGAAGPGKTKALLMEAVLQANEFPNVNTILLRRTVPELEGSLILEFERSIPREMYRSFNKTKHLVEWHNGSITKFGSAQHEKDIEQYYGEEWLFVGFDELTRFTLYQWQFMSSRNRCAVPGTFPNMAGASNPGSIGHKWVKQAFGCAGPGEQAEKRAPAGMDVYDPGDYAFIPARIEDNPIYAKDPNYLKTMAHLPKRLREALRLGLWKIFVGQYFDFDPAIHCEPPQTWDIKPWNPRWISIDWGYQHPAAVYWHVLTDDGVTRTYRELVKNLLTPKMLGQGIVDLTGSQSAAGAVGDYADLELEKISDVYLSPGNPFGSRDGAKPIAEQIGDILAAAGIPRPSPADDDRVGGWMLMSQMLESGLWKIGTNCVQLIDTIPAAVHDEKKVEDVAKFDAIDGQGGDDPLESARYGLKSYHYKGRKPLGVRVDDKIREHIKKNLGVKVEEVRPEQYTGIMMRRAQILAEERRAEKPIRLFGRRRH